jgi:hypothetical protein
MKSNSGYHWTAYANPSAEFYCINDIRDVIAGKKPENPSKLWLKASDVAFGLGNGSMNTIQGLGEAVLINGVSYTKSTDQAAENYYQLAHGDRFMTTWAFLMSKEAQPNFKLKNTQLKKPLTILDIYHLIYQKLKNPFFITGVLQCEMLKSSAIAKAWINVVFCVASLKRFWLGITNKVSTHSRITSIPFSAARILWVPSK